MSSWCHSFGGVRGKDRCTEWPEYVLRDAGIVNGLEECTREIVVRVTVHTAFEMPADACLPFIGQGTVEVRPELSNHFAADCRIRHATSPHWWMGPARSVAHGRP